MEETDQADWSEKFAIHLCRAFPNLHAKKGKRSEVTKCAGFELGPRLDYMHNLYIECRWEPHSKSPERAAAETFVARIVIQLGSSFKGQSTSLCKQIETFESGKYQVFTGATAGPVYITKTGLPALDLTIPPNKQLTAIQSYGQACSDLQSYWRLYRDRLPADLQPSAA
ncbi:hypothetical protein NA78x_002074 [Anatilimnocola sp. NA78]|uniref:hypothetical protein n=1 Tax=Anatilimnocola sp. NA78 TaxID=3415683 RepID=UPI003CE581FA